MVNDEKFFSAQKRIWNEHQDMDVSSRHEAGTIRIKFLNKRQIEKSKKPKLSEEGKNRV